jgi:RNA:NAD 2'-phosphotransferase (TPT1/KptA family)
VPDLKLLALTYMLEREQNGIANIRTEPPLLTKEKAARAKAAKAAAKAKAGGALPPGMSKKAAARLARLSRTLAWILRHGAEKVGLTPDEQGFVAVADLLEVDQMKKRKPRVTEENIRSAVRADTEGMFSLLSVKVPTSASDRARTASG